MFERNIHTYSVKEQLKLHQSKVVILGVGGGGCCVAEILARTGVGNIVLVDGDYFEESNLNRQIGAEDWSIGEPKVKCMENRIMSINERCKITSVAEFVSQDNFDNITTGSDIVCDTVDGYENKLMVGNLCNNRGLTYVTGGLGGYSYWSAILKNKTINQILKNKESNIIYPCCSGVFAQAALQAQLIINVLLDRDWNVTDKIIKANQTTFTMSVEDF